MQHQWSFLEAHCQSWCWVCYAITRVQNKINLFLLPLLLLLFQRRGLLWRTVWKTFSLKFIDNIPIPKTAALDIKTCRTSNVFIVLCLENIFIWCKCIHMPCTFGRASRLHNRCIVCSLRAGRKYRNLVCSFRTCCRYFYFFQ